MAKAIEAVRRFNGFLFYLYQGNYVSYYTDEEKEGPFTKERTMVDIPLVIQFKKPVRRHRIKAFLYEKRHPS